MLKLKTGGVENKKPQGAYETRTSRARVRILSRQVNGRTMVMVPKVTRAKGTLENISEAGETETDSTGKVYVFRYCRGQNSNHTLDTCRVCAPMLATSEEDGRRPLAE